MWIKICANTNLEDTQMAIDLGADAVGFVFAPSARKVTPELAAAITSQLRGSPPAERIGVFQTTDFQEIRSAIHTAGLTGVQMHHAPCPDLIAALRADFGKGLTITQTLHWPVDAQPDAMARTLSDIVGELSLSCQVDRILVDTKVGNAVGGTGTTFDWQHASELFRGVRGMKMIVAGGLNAENVREAVEQLEPWGMDVASGVEVSPGKKDPERLRLFMQRARAAGQTPSP